MEKFFFSIAFFYLFIITSLFGENVETDSTAMDLRYRNYKYDLFEALYSSVPSAMNLWTGKSWSTMEAKFSYLGRDFKSSQMFSREQSYGFISESIQKIDTLDVIFYGKFMYQTTRDFDAINNLFYTTGDIGSPYYLFVPANGKWQTQKYTVKGGASKSFFNSKIDIGAFFSYSGDLFNRVLDIRNRKTELDIEVYPSMTYHLSQKKSLSFGVDYTRNKKQPSLSNYFPRAGDDTDYWVYFNKGMGTYEHINTGYGLNAISHSFRYTVKWLSKTDKYDFSADLAYLEGTENWQTRFNRPETADFFELTKYEWKEFSGKASIAMPFNSFINLSVLEVSKTDGLGFTFNESNKIFQKAYSFDRLNIKVSSDFIFSSYKLLNKLGIDVSMTNTDRLDLNYAQKTSVAQLYTSLDVGFIKLPLFKGDIYFDVNLLHSYNLDAIHNPVSAATNMYTTEILQPLLRYQTADFIAFSPSVNWEKQIINNLIIGVELGGTYINPYKINYTVNNAPEFGTNKGMNFAFRVVF